MRGEWERDTEEEKVGHDARTFGFVAAPSEDGVHIEQRLARYDVLLLGKRRAGHSAQTTRE